MPFIVKAENLGKTLSGQILLDVERNGEAWYVYPEDNRRYYLGRPADAFSIMRELGLGITEVDFQRIAQSGMNVDGDLKLARRLSGKIILQVERNGEAWYIYPKDLKKYYLGRPDDAFRIMRELSLGITRENLAKVHKPGLEESIDQYSKYEHTSINTSAGSYTIDMVTINLDNPDLEIITDATALHPAPDNDKYEGYFGAQSLGKFVLEHDGFAAINGTYFCSYDTCESHNYYFFPIYDSTLKKMINEDELKYPTTGPLIAFDEENTFYYYKDSRDFGSLGNFNFTTGFKLQAAIGNQPRLIEEGMNLLIDWNLDDKQRYIKAVRNAIGFREGETGNNKGFIYLVVVSNANLNDLAEVMKALGVDYALNLDGGNSAALWYNDEYMVGPGRDIPNVIIFREK